MKLKKIYKVAEVSNIHQSKIYNILCLITNLLGWLAHTCNLSTLGGQGGRIAWDQEFETNLGNIVRPCTHLSFPKYWDYRHGPLHLAQGVFQEHSVYPSSPWSWQLIDIPQDSQSTPAPPRTPPSLHPIFHNVSNQKYTHSLNEAWDYLINTTLSLPVIAPFRYFQCRKL